MGGADGGVGGGEGRIAAHGEQLELHVLDGLPRLEHVVVARVHLALQAGVGLEQSGELLLKAADAGLRLGLLALLHGDPLALLLHQPRLPRAPQ